MQTVLAVALILLAGAVFVFGLALLVLEAGRRQRAKRSEAVPETPPPDPFTAALLAESRGLIRELFQEFGLQDEELEAVTMAKVAELWRKEPPWKALVPRIVQEVRPMLRSVARQTAAGLRKAPNPSAPPPGDVFH